MRVNPVVAHPSPSPPPPSRVPACVARTLHDVIVTEHHYVLVQPPLTFNLQRFMGSTLAGEASFAECMDYDEAAPAKLHVIPRPRSGRGVGAAKAEAGTALQRTGTGAGKGMGTGAGKEG